jgi:hypothetical protein
VVLELAFGNWIFPDRLNRLNICRDQTLRYTVDHLYDHDGKEIVYSRDKWGFRGDYPSVSEIDILTIGGSTTDQRYITDGETWPDVLQQEFLRHDREVYVVNAGVDGQSTYGHIRNFEWWFANIPDLEVRYFLFYIGINDFYRQAAGMGDTIRKRESRVGGVGEYVASKSALCDLGRKLEGVLMASRYNAAHEGIPHEPDTWVDHPRQRDHEALLAAELDQYEHRLHQLCDRVEALGAKPIFVTQSARRLYDVTEDGIKGTPEVGVFRGKPINGVDYCHMMRLLNDRTMSMAQQRGAVCIDLDRQVEFDLAVDLYDHSHATPSGALKIGKCLYRHLTDVVE